MSASESPESSMAGVSVRGWLAIILVVSVCILSGMGRKIEEPLYSLSVMSVGFYFGQKTKLL